MIDIESYEILSKNISTVKETSKDIDNNEYMSECEMPAVNFDRVVECYCEKCSIATMTSNDSLVIANGDATFVEFKNGYIDKSTIYNIKRKNYDSVLILSDITRTTVSDMRKSLSYILVYNEVKNKENPQSNQEKVYESKSKDAISKAIHKKAKKPYIKYGLEMFKGYCFKEVFTYTKAEFEELFVTKFQEQ